MPLRVDPGGFRQKDGGFFRSFFLAGWVPTVA